MIEEKRQLIPFHQRFDIQFSAEEVQKRFMNRACNMIEGNIPGMEIKMVDSHKPEYVRLALINVATRLGVEYNWRHLFSTLAKTNLYSCLLSLEALYQTYVNEPRYYEYTEKVNYSIKYAISLNEADIGIEWRDGAFWNSGAKLLDEALVNENLKWLTDKGYTNVLSPFEKGLRHFLEAKQKPERLNDTITDIYEAVEALVRIVMENNKDLSKNCESFINKLKLSEYYKKMLDEYLRYANHYSRHAAKLGERKKLLLRNEVEAFIYTSGLFIRLAVQQMTEKSS